MNGTDEDVRTMLRTASSDMPPGIDLLRGVRDRQAPARRPQPRYRLRALVSAGAVAVVGGGTVLATTLTATVAVAPSAFAAVSAAAAKTSAGTFKATMYVTNPPPLPGLGRTQSARVSGEFDQSRGVGEETVSGPWKFQVRYVGQDMYLDTYPGSRQVIFSADQSTKPWAQFPPGPALTGNALGAAGEGVGETPVNPLTLLGLLKSAGTVTKAGPASGPGWTGTKYRFTVTVGKSTAAGYVDVDGQGRLRRLVADLTAGAPGRARRLVIGTEDVTFSDFGAPVSVTAPPASQVYLLKGPVAMIALGW